MKRRRKTTPYDKFLYWLYFGKPELRVLNSDEYWAAEVQMPRRFAWIIRPLLRFDEEPDA